MLDEDDSSHLDAIERRLLFLELLTQKVKATSELYHGLFLELLHRTDATLEPDNVQQQLDGEIEKKMREWICARADDDMAMASLLSALYEDLERKSNDEPDTGEEDK